MAAWSVRSRRRMSALRPSAKVAAVPTGHGPASGSVVVAVLIVSTAVFKQLRHCSSAEARFRSSLFLDSRPNPLAKVVVNTKV